MNDAPKRFDWQVHLEAALDACRRAGEIHREHFRSPGLTVQLKDDASPVTRSDHLAEEAIREALLRATPGLGLLGEELGQEGDERDRWIIDPLDGTRNFVAGLPYFAVLIALQLDGELVLGVVHAPALGPGSGVEAVARPADSSSSGETWWAARGQGAFAGTGTVFTRCCDRRLRVSQVREIPQAFVAHGGLVHFQRMGIWPAFSDLVGRAGRTRGFGDWWGHVLVAEGRCDAMIEGRVALHDVAPMKPILEEAGGVLIARGDAPLDAGFHEATLSCNRHLAGELRQALGF
jgi:histidinol-phosphatase